MKITELWNLIIDILDDPENVTTYLTKPDRPCWYGDVEKENGKSVSGEDLTGGHGHKN